MRELENRLDQLKLVLAKYDAPEARELQGVAQLIGDYCKVDDRQEVRAWSEQKIRSLETGAGLYVRSGHLLCFMLVINLLDALRHDPGELRLQGIIDEFDLVFPIANLHAVRARLQRG